MLVLLLIRHGYSVNNELEDECRAEHGPENYRPHYKEKQLPDPGLASQGVEEAKLVAQCLKDVIEQLPKGCSKFPIALWSSPMARCLDTSSPILEELKVLFAAQKLRQNQEQPFRVVQDMYEYGGCNTEKGTYKGATPEEIHQKYGHLGFVCDEDISKEGWYVRYDQSGGELELKRESHLEANERADRVSKRLHELSDALCDSDEPNQIVILVSHGNFMQRLLRKLVLNDSDAKIGLFPETASTSALQFPKKNGKRGEDELKLLWFNKIAHLSSIESRPNTAQTGTRG